jgi:ribosomal protein L25 (general stress protein Ctc)
MKQIKYLTPAEVEKVAKHKIAEIGSVFAPIRKIHGTITTNVYGKRYNTAEVSIMLYTKEFWKYWEMKAKQENAYLELYADKAITEIQI